MLHDDKTEFYHTTVENKIKKQMFGPEINEQLQRLERQIADMECRALTSETEVMDQLRADL